MKKLLFCLFYLATIICAIAQTADYTPPPLGSSAKLQRDDLQLEYTNINNLKVDFTDIDSCAEIAAIIVGDTGSCGGFVLSISPTLVTPNLGVPTFIDLSSAINLPDGGIAAAAVDGGSAGEIQDGTIDGEDMNANYAGAGLIETPGSPDVIDIALHATGPGLSLSGDVLSLIRTCADGELLKFTAAAGWACATDAGAAGGDSGTVNGNAFIDFDLDDATPAAPAGGVNCTWQKDGSSPANVSCYVPKTESFCIAASDEVTAITTGASKVTFNIPYAFTVTAVTGYLNTVSSSGAPAIDINEDPDAEGATAKASILSTVITIDANERRSSTAATPPVISDTAIAADAEMTIDIDTAGTGAKGLKVCLEGYPT